MSDPKLTPEELESLTKKVVEDVVKRMRPGGGPGSGPGFVCPEDFGCRDYACEAPHACHNIYSRG